MKTKSKKILLSLALATVVSLPFAAVSCGNKTEPVNTLANVYFQLDKNKMNNFYNPQTKVLDLSSTNLKEIGEAEFSTEALQHVVIADEEWHAQVYDKELKKIVIKKVILPASLTKIKKGAFLGLGLEEIDFSKATSLEEIEEKAFSENSLTTIILPESVKFVNKHAFSFNKLTSVTLSSQIVELAPFVFYGNDLTSLNLDKIIKVNSFALGQNKFANLSLPETLKTFSSDALDSKETSENTNKVQLEVKNADLKKALISENENNKHNYTII